jgi:TonB family protein
MKDTRRFVFCLLPSASVASFFPHRTGAQDQPEEDQICEVRKVGDCRVTAPKPLYHPDPEYTDRARRKKISGMVLLLIVVTPEGRVRDAKVTASPDKDLDRQALKAVSTWRFQPATKYGKPVPVRIAVERTSGFASLWSRRFVRHAIEESVAKWLPRTRTLGTALC